MNRQGADEAVRVAGLVQFGLATIPVVYNLKYRDYNPVIDLGPADLLVGLVLAVAMMRRSFIASVLAFLYFACSRIMNADCNPETRPYWWAFAILVGLLLLNGCAGAYWLRANQAHGNTPASVDSGQGSADSGQAQTRTSNPCTDQLQAEQAAMSGHMPCESAERAPHGSMVNLRQFAELTGMVASMAAAASLMMMFFKPDPLNIIGSCGPAAVFGFIVSQLVVQISRLAAARPATHGISAFLGAGLLASLTTGGTLLGVMTFLHRSAGSEIEGGFVRLALRIVLPCVMTGIVMAVIAALCNPVRRRIATTQAGTAALDFPSSPSSSLTEQNASAPHPEPSPSDDKP